MIGLFFTDQTIIFDDTGRTGKGATIQLQFARGLISESFNCISSLTTHIILNTVISLNFLLWTFCERHSFPRVSGDSPKTLRKLCLSAKFPHQEIRWNYGILRSDRNREVTRLTQNLSKKLVQKNYHLKASSSNGECNTLASVQCWRFWNILRNELSLWNSLG